MQDIVFVAVIIGFFAQSVLFVKACELILRPERGLVGWEDVVGLGLSVAVLALRAPEKLG